jgi:hypothetical protein
VESGRAGVKAISASIICRKASLGVCEGFDGDERVGPAGDIVEDECEDIGKRGLSPVRASRIWKVIEVSTKERQGRRGARKPFIRRSE